MATPFGSTVDPFGFADGTNLILTGDVTETTRESAVVTAQDANGDIADVANVTQTVKDVEYEMIVKTSTALASSSIMLGEIEAGKIVSGVTISTAPGQSPRIKITGLTGAIAVDAPTGKENTAKLPALTISPAMIAQALGFTVTTGQLNSCEVTFTCDVTEEANGVGVNCAYGVSNFRGTITAEFVQAGDTAPAWSVTLTGATETHNQAPQQKGANFKTCTKTAFIKIDREAS